jgi:hypothetical protein
VRIDLTKTEVGGFNYDFLYLKIVRQQGGVARKASDAAIGVVKHDDVKLPAASRNLFGNLTDSPE